MSKVRMPRQAYNITGQVFGKLTAVEYLGAGLWRCECECGGEREVKGTTLRTGKATSCLSCSDRRGPVKSELTAADLAEGKRPVGRPPSSITIGATYGQLTAISYIKAGVYLTQCSCGEMRQVTGSQLRRGNVTRCKSCMTKYRRRLIRTARAARSEDNKS